jgi:putative tricarboxylic transport membrane protein
VSLEKKRSAKGELVFTSFLFVAGVVVLWDASQLPDAMGVDFVGTKTFPSIIGAILVALSLIQLISVARGNVGEPEGIEGGEADSKVHFKPLLLMLAGLLAFAIGLQYIGFLLSSTILFSLVTFALNRKKTKWYVIILIAAGFSVLLYVAFNYGLQIKLPLGFDFNFGSSEVVVEEEW